MEVHMTILLPVDTLIAAAVLSINAGVSVLSLALIMRNEGMKKAFLGMNVVLRKLYVFLFVGPLFISPFVPQPRFPSLPWHAELLGILPAAAGAAVIACSFLKIGFIPSIRADSGLSTSGTYGIVRHPIYSGTVMAFFGLSVLMRGFVSLAYVPVSVLLYYLMAASEEKDLLKAYGEDYAAYQKKVRRRLIPFVL
jgi:protein-S-isoprenylcysteine O-methyltransferase Ste14